MASDRDDARQLQALVLDACHAKRRLRLVGSNSKGFYGRVAEGETLSLSDHRGVVSYAPTELVITARGGTPLVEIERLLAEKEQMLPFEPPHFNGGGTIGGAVAAGLSGPRRPWGGAPRDLLLGIKLLDGRGRILNFGGQVMKNVAGYDLSRLMAGALGTLGILLEVSVKVLPKPPQEHTLMFFSEDRNPWKVMRDLLGKAIPITATCSQGKRHKLRLACNERRLKQIQTTHGLETIENQQEFWQALRDQELDFFQCKAPLWRISLPPAAVLDPGNETLNEWANAQRWLVSERPAEEIRALAEEQTGHATLFRYGDRSGELFHPLQPRLAEIQRQLKQVFDPNGIFNPGRHYSHY
ncbi:MAG: glycolate oxidase subunit GlcE [Candidatus Thiodiazotropha sp. (ex Epidulcina cf. delphinae)]|nr:glycolate oxidase subunit GlcE [Candidatus Thiodiazotropha sp. (ex Epidulcina cf. delphinae)]